MATEIEIAARQRWMATLAKAEPAFLEQLIDRLEILSAHHCVRPPETGMVMVQARAGGTGRVFNFGETTVTRCTVTTQAGFTGHAYIMGRNRRHAELAALMDAHLNDPATAADIMTTVVEPLETEWQRRANLAAARTAATKVDFFTMVRGKS
jgi:alpha-D-ribose 1-methylphosphonate 5-triphosphate synthase subunit PhnG